MTPAAVTLLQELRAAGLELESVGTGALGIKPKVALTPDRRRAVLEHKPELLAVLNLEHRVKAMAARWHYDSDELADALKRAHADPAGWLLAVVMDEDRAAVRGEA